MQEFENYAHLLKCELENNRFENIVDSNILTAYIPYNFPIPRIDDPRKTQAIEKGTPRYPGYVKSAQINQIFNYIGFIKRVNDRELAGYLPMLFYELKRFIRVIEEVIYAPSICITTDIHAELNNGVRQFFRAYHNRSCHRDSWIEDIWKHQKLFLEHIDMFLETLRKNGQVFDLKSHPLHGSIVDFCKDYFEFEMFDPPSETDICFVANCCTKSGIERESKTIWSGDRHIHQILNAIYRYSDLSDEFPQIYLRASYLPLRFNQLFPDGNRQYPGHRAN